MLVAPPPHLHDHRRIVLHGVTGSGKWTLGARPAALTGAPYVSVDDLMWRPGWVQLTAEEQVGDPAVRRAARLGHGLAVVGDPPRRAAPRRPAGGAGPPRAG